MTAPVRIVAYRRYHCDSCDLEFLVPLDAPRLMNGLKGEDADFLSRPWCDSNSEEVVTPGQER